MNSGSQKLVFAIAAGAGFICAMVVGLVPVGLYPIALLAAILSLLASVLAFALKDYFYLFPALIHMKNMTAVIDDSEPFYLSPSPSSDVIDRLLQQKVVLTGNRKIDSGALASLANDPDSRVRVAALSNSQIPKPALHLD